MIKSKSCSGYFLSPKVVPLKKFFIRVGAPEVKHLLLLLLNRHWSRDHKSKREKIFYRRLSFRWRSFISFIWVKTIHSPVSGRLVKNKGGRWRRFPRFFFFAKRCPIWDHEWEETVVRRRRGRRRLKDLFQLISYSLHCLQFVLGRRRLRQHRQRSEEKHHFGSIWNIVPVPNEQLRYHS